MYHLLTSSFVPILNSLCRWNCLHLDSGECLRFADSHELALAQPVNHLQHAPGDDVYGYEDAGERWLPVHSVETVVSSLDANFTRSYVGSTDTALSVLLAHLGHQSVIARRARSQLASQCRCCQAGARGLCW